MSTNPGRSAAAVARRELGDAAVLTPAQAVILLGDGEARAWLEREGLIHRLPFGERVVWREVLEAIERAPSTREPVMVQATPKRWKEANY